MDEGMNKWRKGEGEIVVRKQVNELARITRDRKRKEHWLGLKAYWLKDREDYG